MKIVISADDEVINRVLEEVRKAQADYNAYKYDGTLATWKVQTDLFWEMMEAEAELGRLFLSRVDDTLIKVEEDVSPE